MAYRRHHTSFLGLLLGGSRGSPVYRMVTSGFMLLAAMTLFLIWVGQMMAYDEMKRTCISTVDAEIVSVTRSTSNDAAYDALVKFEVAGKPYTMHTGYTIGRKEVGGTVPVHYYPTDPERAYCYDEPKPPNSKYAGMGIFAAVFAVIIFIFALDSHRKGVESGGVIGDYLKSKKAFSDDSWAMDDKDLMDAKVALAMPEYAHEKSQREYEKSRRGRYY